MVYGGLDMDDAHNIIFDVCDEVCEVMERRGWLERVERGAIPTFWQLTDAGRKAVMAILQVESAMRRGRGGANLWGVGLPDRAVALENHFGKK